MILGVGAGHAPIRFTSQICHPVKLQRRSTDGASRRVSTRQTRVSAPRKPAYQVLYWVKAFALN